MKRNVIFVFSGTGNSLWAAREIAKSLNECEIKTMGINAITTLTETYDRIGFVYPTYAGGMPKRVKEFITSLEVGNQNKSAYYFSVATCGRISRAQNVITQLKILLDKKGLKLSFGERLDMFSNYVVGYEMRSSVLEEAHQAAIDIKPMVEMIKSKHSFLATTKLTSRNLTSLGFMKIVSNMDKNFNVSNFCTHCGICEKVCPVKNIKMDIDRKPIFMHTCEQCLACIQLCPNKAINYKNKTQERGRYQHPDITWKSIESLNHSS